MSGTMTGDQSAGILPDSSVPEVEIVETFSEVTEIIGQWSLAHGISADTSDRLYLQGQYRLSWHRTLPANSYDLHGQCSRRVTSALGAIRITV